MALDADERQLVVAVFMGGPRILIDRGMDAEEVREFLARDEVKHLMSLLHHELLSQQEIEARSKFTARRELAAMSSDANRVLARALEGPVYARGPHGEILRDEDGMPLLVELEPTPIQLRAAQVVLDSLNIKDTKSMLDHVQQQFDPARMLGSAEDDTKPLLEYPEDYNREEHRAMSRERIRLALDKLAPKVEQIHKALTGAKGRDEEAEDAEVEMSKKPKVKRRKKTDG